MAEVKISSAPDILTTRGLGSCVGIVLYDSIKQIGGLAHPMLPDIEKARIKTNPAKFVDSVIKMMID
ncbi:MAG: chemotaxis protein CheD [Candidatus Omnitrophota bacterium]